MRWFFSDERGATLLGSNINNLFSAIGASLNTLAP